MIKNQKECLLLYKYLLITSPTWLIGENAGHMGDTYIKKENKNSFFFLFKNL